MAAFPVAEPPITSLKPSRCGRSVKRLLLGVFLLAITGVLYFTTHAFLLLPEDGKLSQKEISTMLKEWADEHPVKKVSIGDDDLIDDWLFSDKQDMHQRTRQQEPMTSPTRVLSNREKSDIRELAKVKRLRRKYDQMVEILIKEPTNPPFYVNYDLNRWDDGYKYDCVILKSKPNVPICLYPDEEDVFVSKQIRSLGMWEKHIMKRFQGFLADDISLGVIDVGANLGQYSLVSAAMGHSVLAVEPWEATLRRLRHGIKMADLQGKIRVLKNVVSDTRGQRCLHSTGDNQGDVHIVNVTKADDIQGRHTLEGAAICQQKAFSLFLDDLVANVTFKKALLKLDIQGQEHRAFLHVEALLDAIFVPHIFMEWVIMRSFYVTNSHESLDKALVRRMLAVLKRRGYRVFSLVSGRELDIRYWHGWPEDVLWSHARALA